MQHALTTTAFTLDGYRITRKKELERESVREALIKMIRTPLSELLRTVSREDLRRNLKRISSSVRAGDFGKKG